MEEAKMREEGVIRRYKRLYEAEKKPEKETIRKENRETRHNLRNSKHLSGKEEGMFYFYQ